MTVIPDLSVLQFHEHHGLIMAHTCLRKYIPLLPLDLHIAEPLASAFLWS